MNINVIIQEVKCNQNIDGTSFSVVVKNLEVEFQSWYVPALVTLKSFNAEMYDKFVVVELCTSRCD